MCQTYIRFMSHLLDFLRNLHSWSRQHHVIQEPRYSRWKFEDQCSRDTSRDPGLLQHCGFLGGATKYLLDPLSHVLRAAAHLILLIPRTSSIWNEIRTVLQWLVVPTRATFKLRLLAHRCLHGSAPPYLIRYFTPVSSIVGRSHLRSAATGTLFVARSQTSTIIVPRAFAVSSPSAWNSLPADLCDPGLSRLTFRRRLKTYLFIPPDYISS